MKRITLLFSSALMVLSFSATTAWAQDCPNVLSVPATQPEVECFALYRAPRCGAITPAQCTQLNGDSFVFGLLEPDAYVWLQQNSYCAISVRFGSFNTIVGICPSFGIHGDSALLAETDDGLQEWVSAQDVTAEYELMSLSENALLSEPVLNSAAIADRMAGSEIVDLYVFALSNGRTLSVGQHQAMVLADGKVVAAREVVAGDLFIGFDGSEVMVEDIEYARVGADLYNLAVAAETPQEHVIVVEGVLVGDHTWRGSAPDEGRSIQLRR